VTCHWTFEQEVSSDMPFEQQELSSDLPLDILGTLGSRLYLTRRRTTQSA
jgi:hypothetical protein